MPRPAEDDPEDRPAVQPGQKPPPERRRDQAGPKISDHREPTFSFSFQRRCSTAVRSIEFSY